MYMYIDEMRYLSLHSSSLKQNLSTLQHISFRCRFAADSLITMLSMPCARKFEFCRIRVRRVERAFYYMLSIWGGMTASLPSPPLMKTNVVLRTPSPGLNPRAEVPSLISSHKRCFNIYEKMTQASE